MDRNDLIKTQDNSLTFYDPVYNECMHSLSGAYDEALYKHVLPSKVLEYTHDINVLDVGFGIGYNVLALINEYMKLNKNHNLNIISLEKNNNIHKIMEAVKFNDFKDNIYDMLKIAAIKGFFKSNNIKITILFGDARKSLLEMNNKFDAVFYDPYSPGKNPEMWTVDIFKKLYSLCNDHTIITTYSSAIHIRMAMKQAGFMVGPGPSVGGKKEGTLATVKNKSISHFSDEYFKEISKIHRSIPFKDPYLNNDPDFIFKRRLQEMEDLRKSKSGLQVPE